jgi:hypothetical protein
MELTVPERLILDDLLAEAEGDLVLLRSVRTLRAKIGFSADEVKRMEMKSIGPQIEWNEKEAKVEEIEILPPESEIIVSLFERKSAMKKLRQIHLDLYERFVKS